MARRTGIPGAEVLARMASIVAGEEGAQVALAAQTDATFTVKAAPVHPVQVLENSYQRAIREASFREPDPGKRQAVERLALARYFPFAAGELELVAAPDGAAELVDARFEAGRAAISQVRELAQGRVNDGAGGTADHLEAGKELCREALAICEALLGDYDAIGGEMGYDARQIPIVRELHDMLGTGAAELRVATDWSAMAAVTSGTLRRLLLRFSQLLEGLACVQVFHVIDTFYLYRLLVRYRVEGDQEPGDDLRMAVSGGLTGLLNNGVPVNQDRVWLSDWLKAKMREIDVALQRIGNVHFHLKGGRALEYVRRLPEEGRNDWDTSVLIDPALSADAWYAKFAEIHNDLVPRLQRFKQEFFVLVHKHAGAINASLDAYIPKVKPREEAVHDGDHPEEDDFEAGARDYDAMDGALSDRAERARNEDDDGARGAPGGIPFPRFAAACKAELIDIGIPRRDTVDAIAHWHHIGPGILRKPWTEQIPVPGHRYYIDEYLMMIREAFETPAKKMEKRISRLANFLSLGTEDNDPAETIEVAVAHARAEAEVAGLAKSLAVVDAQSVPVKRLMYVMLEEIASSHELRSRPALGGVIDGVLATQASDAALRAGLPATYPAAIADALPALSEQHKEVLSWIALVHAISRRFETHLADKAAYFGFCPQLATGAPAVSAEEKARGDAIVALVRWLHGESAFRPDREHEVQFAITGAYACALHADYARNRLPAALKQQLQIGLDPVEVVDLKLFCHPDPRRAIDPATVLEALVRPLVEEYAATKNPPFAFQFHPDRIDVVWKDEVKIRDVSYRPMVARIRVVKEGWPLLAYVWGLPVLSLADLIREYFSRASLHQDFLAEKRLKQTAALLTSLLTYFEANDAIDPDAVVVDPSNDVDKVLTEIAQAEALTKSNDKSVALQGIARRAPYDERIVARILQACGTLASSQVAPVLFSLLDRDDLTTQGYVAVAGGAKAITSSSEKEVLLMRYAEVAPLVDRVFAALLDATASMKAAEKIADVLIVVAERHDVTSEIKGRLREFAQEFVNVTRHRNRVIEAL